MCLLSIKSVDTKFSLDDYATLNYLPPPDNNGVFSLHLINVGMRNIVETCREKALKITILAEDIPSEI